MNAYRRYIRYFALTLTCLAGSASAQPTAADIPGVLEAWINNGNAQRSMVQSIGVRFDRNAVDLVKEDALRIRSIETGAMIDLSGAVHRYDPVNNSANWVLDRDPAALLPDGNYIAWIETDQLLSAPERFACGPNLPPVDDFVFGFHQYAGDADGDRDVDFRDSALFRQAWQQRIENERYRDYLDFNLSNLVENTDQGRIRSTYFSVLAPEPALHLYVRNDTGDDPGDNRTDRYAVGVGTVGLDAGVQWFARFGGGFVDVSGSLNASGGALDESTVDGIFGSALPIGTHTLTLEARDAGGSVLATQALNFDYIGELSCGPYFITEPSPGVSLGSVRPAEPLDLSDWDVFHFPGSQSQANWVLRDAGLTAEQTVNAAPSALVSPDSLQNLRITGEFRVDTSSDDDYMGFVFGFRDERQFYVFGWKGRLQGIALQGMSIRRMERGDAPFDENDFWSGLPDREKMELLVPPNGIGWDDFATYEITLDFVPGRVAVTVLEGGVLLDELVLEDDRFNGGRFGFYNYSQSDVIYSGFTQASLDNLYFYNAEAIDPDGGPVAYRLVDSPGGIAPPAGAEINPETGALLWTPDTEGTFPFTIEASDVDGNIALQTFDVEVAPVDEPPTITLQPSSPAVLPGESFGIRVIARDDQGLFRVRLFQDGREVIRGDGSDLEDGVFTTSIDTPGSYEFRGIAIDSADQLTEARTYVRVLNPTDTEANPGQTPISPPGQTPTGTTPADIRPEVSFQSPLAPADDPTRLVGTVDDGGGTLREWALEWAPSVEVDPNDPGDPTVLWQAITDGTTPFASGEIAVITPGNFPDETITFRLRAENNNGLGSIATLSYNPRATGYSSSDTSVGTGSGNAPTVGFTAPLSLADDSSRVRGSVDPNGETLREWLLEYAPRSEVPSDGLASDDVNWTLLERGTSVGADQLLATLTTANLPDALLVFRLSAYNTNGLGAITSLTYNPSADSYSGPTGTSGTNPATDIRPFVAITSPRSPTDPTDALIGTVSANGGSLDRWVVDYALLSAVNPQDLRDPSVAWTLLDEGTDERANAPITGLDVPDFQSGRWVVRLRAFNDNGLGGLASTTLDTGDTSQPSVAFTSPVPEADVMYLTDISGTVTSGGGTIDYWTLEYSPAGQANLANLNAGNAWVEFARGDGAVSDGPLGTFDPTLLRNGAYILRLSAFNTNGRGFSDGLLVYVCGEAKLGNFRVEFEDLKIPVAGIPIRILRSYNSLDAGRQGDFGPGWSFNIAEGELTESVPGLGDTIFFDTPFEIGTRVFITNPDGERIGFTFAVRNPRNRFIYVDYEPYFIPDPGVDETLSIAPSEFQRVEVDTSGAVYTPLYPIGYNPDRYHLTMRDGTVYEYDQSAGLQRIFDDDGNTLTFSRSGITHSDGTAISIQRDSSGRITAIEDPDGRTIRYSYDANGRLRFHTDREGARTEFVYSEPRNPNYLSEIIDPAGTPAVRSEYDAEGRLVRQIGPRGGAVSFDYDPDGRTQTVTDRLGNVTFVEFDAMGNVTREVDAEGGETTYDFYPGTTRERRIVDPVGNVTSRAYDASGNITRITLGADAAEDPENPSTGTALSFEYDSQNRLTQLTDANGNISRIDFDPATGGIIGLTEGEGAAAAGTTNYAYTATGEMQRIVDPLGNETTYTYIRRGDPAFDDAGLTDTQRIVEKVLRNEAGTTMRRVREYEDRYGNVLRRANYRTLPDGTEEAIAVDYVYNDENQLLLAIHPNGRVEESRYDVLGRLITVLIWSSEADYVSGDQARARVTRFTYDVAGNLLQTEFPDGSTTSTTYDAENQVIAETDSLGRTTRYEYDGAGRLRFTRFPDATPGSLADNPVLEFRYDLAGRRIAVIDERGNLTESTYDALDQETERTVHLDAATRLTTRFEYDPDGNLSATIDPKGNRTEYAYDARNRPSETVHPATATDSTATERKVFDAAGRVIEERDVTGRGKSFTYDALGRLTSVVFLNASGNPVAGGDGTATYEYDEVGNQTAQIDAEGNRTEFRYNQMGWLTETILPEGQIEAYTYDAFGNLLTRTDAAGYTTTYTYDSMNRLIRTEADPSHPSLALGHAPAVIENTYNLDGTIATSRVLNAASVVLYDEAMTYDARGRLIEKASGAGTLSYAYTGNGLVETVASDAAEGLSLGYSYDAANRLIGVQDNRSILPDTRYTYDRNGNLDHLILPNGIEKSFAYNTRNQLVDLVIEDAGANLLRRYNYTLNARGDRLRVEEANGRIRNYLYDDLYRLTSEDFSGGGLASGLVAYGFDGVGNRLSRSSSFGPITPQSLSYDGNNRIDGTTYDANGNTLNSPLTLSPYQGNDVYDFRDRLIRRERIDGTNVNLLYNADGIRVGKTITTGASSQQTNYLVDANNPTGYAQVVEERSDAGDLITVYAYGLDLIARRDNFSGTPEERFFIHDGSGSVVALADASGAILESYEYDAYGNRIDGGGPADSRYLYRGEQFDPDLGLYYLRARYMHPGTGRFWTMDRFDGFIEDPLSLHKYLYAHGNPVTYEDPAGLFSIAGFSVTFTIQSNLRNVQAKHIKKATATMAKQFLKVAIASAERYLDFRGYATYNLSPITNASVYVPKFQAFTLSPGGTLILDLLYSETLAFLVGSALSGGISHIAGSFSVVKIGAKVSIGKFAMELKKLYKYIQRIGAAIGNAANDFAQKFVVVRMITQAKTVYDILKAFKGKVETAAKYAPIAMVAFDYWVLQKTRLEQLRAGAGF